MPEDVYIIPTNENIEDIPDNIMCVYGIIENNILMYVGSTVDLKRRIKEHVLYSLTGNRKVYEYIRSKGGIKNFTFTVLDFVKDEEMLVHLEQLHYEDYEPELNSVRPVNYKTDILCKCGLTVNTRYLNQHLKTKKHLKKMNY